MLNNANKKSYKLAVKDQKYQIVSQFKGKTNEITTYVQGEEKEQNKSEHNTSQQTKQ
jgi:hypothetical protein